MFRYTLVCLLLFCQVVLFAQQLDTNIAIGEVVISATRTAKKVEDIASPITVIDAKQIQQSGFSKLNEVLAEQTGISISEDHGTGIQIQGFDPEYTMILIDSEPLIGRTAGTLNLKRISLRNIERIEIIKGGSSCMYGSAAMAGAVNIITKKPAELNVQAYAKYGSFATNEIGTTVSGKAKETGWFLFFNRNASAGFDVQPERPGMSVGPSESYSLNPKLYWTVFKKWELQTSLRLYHEAQKPTEITLNETSYKEHGSISEGALAVALNSPFRKGGKWQFRLYSTLYDANSSSEVVDEAVSAVETNFTQQYSKAEVNYEKVFSRFHRSNVGVGLVHENMLAERYTGDTDFESGFAFIQHEYRPDVRLQFVGGLRYDIHDSFGQRLSPKLTALYKAFPFLTAKLSFGSGFKAPDFRQLYMNFNNQVAGYTVYGVKNVEEGLTQLESQGKIAQRLSSLNQTTLTPEFSNSVNASLDFKIKKQAKISVGGFYNQVANLIETLPVAEKNNGQFVYSYYNVSKMVSRGIEVNANWQINQQINVAAGYNYLQAFNPESKQQVANGEVFVRDAETLTTKRLQPQEYIGFFNRPGHQFNCRVSVQMNKGWSAYVRYLFKDKTGFADSNGNLIYDVYDQSAPASHFVNASVSKEFNKWSIQLNAENILNRKVPQFQPQLAGRIWGCTLFWTPIQPKIK